ncbi:MBOAT family protein [Hyphobacterium sp. CCMP332]|nr:MBOAT family protein [Hyphobacterium sp. CCMP332]
MLFNSIDFAVFLPIVFGIYWLLRNKLQWQNLFVVIASYIFYGWWDWRFLSLIIFSTLVDYLVGLRLEMTSTKQKRKYLLILSLLTNLGLLGFFKYYNFFLDNFTRAFSFFGTEINGDSLNIVLPVGISFYTFQTLSYTIDIYRNNLKPTRDFLAFAAFVSFFPQLVAGPIERAVHLLPQFFKKRVFDYGLAVDGCRQILWGLFKKVVIADNCAYYVNMIFDNPESYSGSTLLLGAVLFAFQIYGDFSGYSDIAIGTARLFGFDLMKNFAFPYFSRDIAEFWRRWHISLSTWFRDYLYIPLGGSKGSKYMQIRNIMIIFVVSGFWHGANWTFIVWGALNALYFLPLMILGQNRKNLDTAGEGRFFPDIKTILSIGITFLITCLAWIFFRSESIAHAMDYYSHMLSMDLFSIPFTKDFLFLKVLLLLILVFTMVEWQGRTNEFAIQKMFGLKSRPLRWLAYYAIVFAIILLAGKQEEFIYFQF